MKENYTALAYVTVPASENWRWIGIDNEQETISLIDTDYVTHINFAFGLIKSYKYQGDKFGCPIKYDGDAADKEAYKDSTDGKYHYRASLSGWIEEANCMVDGGKYLKALVDLKKKKPNLKVILSIGGWDSDGFCYMAKTKEGRMEFAQSCADIVALYDLDGIDIDWEFPQNGGWGKIASCSNCVHDAGEMLKDLREVLDERFENSHKILSIASGAGVPWVNREVFKNLDYMNVMCYDHFEGENRKQADLEDAKIFMKNHMNMIGDTKENRKKVNFGVPFYNGAGKYLVPYFKEWNGIIDASAEIIKEKMQWLREEGFGGGFYWSYSMDKFECDTDNPSEIKALQKTVYLELNGKVTD